RRVWLGRFCFRQLALPGAVSLAARVFDGHGPDRRARGVAVAFAWHRRGNFGVAPTGTYTATRAVWALSENNAGAGIAHSSSRTNTAGRTRRCGRRGDAARHGDAGNRYARVLPRAARLAGVRPPACAKGNTAFRH